MARRLKLQDCFAKTHGFDFRLPVAAENAMLRQVKARIGQTGLGEKATALAVVREFMATVQADRDRAQAALVRRGQAPELKSSSLNPRDAFYSQLERVVESKFPARGSAEQLLNPLGEYIVTETKKDADGKSVTKTVGRFPITQKQEAEALASKTEGGRADWQSANRIKEEEVKWSGIIPWAQSQEQPLTKEAVLGYLRGEGAVRFEEVTMGRQNDWFVRRRNVESGPFDSREEAQRYLNDPLIFTDAERGEATIASEPSTAGRFSEARDTSKYAQYQLPGGSNYREVVLAMPDSNKDVEKVVKGFMAVSKDGRHKSQSFSTEGEARAWVLSTVQRSGESPYTYDINPTEFSYWVREGANYKSSHFPDVPNYVAHMRLNEREDADGNAGLFMEEAQSDRHQAGREKGYVSDNPTAGWTAVMGSKGVNADIYTVYDQSWNRVSNAIASSAEEAIQEAAKEMGRKAIPDAPYRTTWPLQLFKRVLADAVAAGKQWIGWTTGETQAERFDLSKQVDAINWLRGRGMIHITGIKNGQQVIEKGDIKPDDLADVIGKELAKKVAESRAQAGTLEGADLKIGGEGMKGFYDSILPKEVGKYVKQWGAGVVKAEIGYAANDDLQPILTYEQFRSREGFTPDENVREFYAKYLARRQKQTPIWRVDITPQMRAGVAAGQALFSSSLGGPKSYRKALPDDNARRDKMLTAADLLIKKGEKSPEGVATPQLLAEVLDSISPNLRVYSQTFWGIVTSVDKSESLPLAPDWQAVYDKKDGIVPVEPEKPAKKPKAKPEQPILETQTPESIEADKKKKAEQAAAKAAKDKLAEGAAKPLTGQDTTGQGALFADDPANDLFSGPSAEDLANRSAPALSVPADVQRRILSEVNAAVWKDSVAQPIQKDGQALLTALKTGDAAALKALRDKYQKDVERSQGGGGSGPGKVKLPRPGAAAIGRLADSMLRKYGAGAMVPNDERSSTGVESDSAGAAAGNSSSETGVYDDSGRAGKAGRPVGGAGAESGNSAESGGAGDNMSAAGGGVVRDPAVREPAFAVPGRVSGDEQIGGSIQPDATGVAADGRREGDVDEGLVVAGGPGAVAGSNIGSGVANVRAAVPSLTEDQAGDVVFAETRLLEKGKTGVLLTNGTGTGKTFSGLGIVKRMLDRGARDILIVAPSDKVVGDWVATAQRFFGVPDIVQLEGIRDTGRGNRVVVTTYANFGQNNELVKRPWAAVVADEAHYLSQSAQGKETDAGRQFRGLTWHPGQGAFERTNRELADVVAELQEIRARMDRMRGEGEFPEVDRLDKRRTELNAQWNQRYAELRAESAAMAEKDRPKAVFLSATPFAYHYSLDYAESYLFPEWKAPTSSAYNSLSDRDAFYVQNLGYRKRYNKLTRPENPAAGGMLERMLADRLMKEGAMRGRSLVVPFDYSRDFVMTPSAVGQKVDEVMGIIMREKGFEMLREILGVTKYLERRFLLEAIKAKEAVPRILKHLALGRQVLVFHDYKKGGAENPLRLYSEDKKAVAEYERLRGMFPGLDDLVKELDDLKSPLEVFAKAFPDGGVFNGDVPSKKRREVVAAFNREGGMRVMLAQRASAKEGISLHDTRGNAQRVFLDLGIPGRPTDAIQSEGRIYRHGVQSNAVMEYLTTGTNFEQWTFAETIAQRASTAENLAMGSRARALLQAFSSGYDSAEPLAPSREQGTGGKAKDAARDAGNQFDEAVALYYTNQKKTARNKAQEGIDYFPTPEPLGLKMVEWLGLRPGEKALEPSAGHGAIARWLPDYVRRYAVEQSYELAGRLALNAPDTTIVQGRFEDYPLANKFNGIVMNPPFGTAGKTAMEHVEKAAGHLRAGGRLVAIIPMGSSMEKRFDAWYESGGPMSPRMVAEVLLPAVAFERAGTKVVARVVVLEKPYSETADTAQMVRRDLTGVQDVREMFDRLREMSVPARAERPVVATTAEPVDSVVEDSEQKTSPPVAEGVFAAADFRHTKTGQPVYVAKITRKLSDAEYAQAKAAAVKAGGYYSSFKGGGAIPGFHFKTIEARDGFVGGNPVKVGNDNVGGGDLRSSPMRDASDAAYLAAVEAGDMETAQRMVDAAAKAAGYVYERGESDYDGDYLGDGDGEAGRGVYAYPTSQPAMRRYYTQRGETRVWIKPLGEVVDLTKESAAVLAQAKRQGITANALNYYKQPFAVMAHMVQAHPSAAGYTVPHNGPGIPSGKQTILNAERISHQSADPVTRDESGRVIPLSERFNPESDSILRAASFASLLRREGIDPDALDEMTERARQETPGERTIGRPDLSLGASDPTIMALDELREVEEQTIAGWDAEARELLKRDYQGTAAMLMARGRTGDTLNPVETRAAQMIVARESRKKMTTAQQRRLQWLVYSYRQAGTEQARSLAARRDPFQTPVERHREFLMRMIFTPPPAVRRQLEAADVAEKELIMQEQRKDLDRIRFELARMGINLDDLFSGEVALVLKNSPLVAKLTASLGEKQRKAVELLQTGVSFSEVAKGSGLSLPDVVALHTEMRAKFQTSAIERMRAMRAAAKATLRSSALDDGMGGIVDAAALAAMSDADAEAAMAKIADKMAELAGLLPKEKQGKMKAVKRKAKRLFQPPGPRRSESQAEMQPELPNPTTEAWLTRPVPRMGFATQPRLEGTTPPAYEGGTPGGGLTKRGQLDLGDLDADETLTGTAEAWGRELFPSAPAWEGEMLVPVGADLGNMVDVMRAARAAQLARATGFDMLLEWWINNLLSGPATHVRNIAGNVTSLMLGKTLTRGVEVFLRGQPAEMVHLWKGLVPGIKRGWMLAKMAWAHEADFFRSNVLDAEVEFDGLVKGESRGPAIAGKTGRVVRVPGRFLAFVDAWFKGIIGQMEAGAQAYRIAKSEGLKGEALTKRMRKEIQTPNSRAWQMAVEKAEEATFQQRLKKLNQQTEKLTATGMVAAGLEHGAAAVSEWANAFKLLKWVLPFIRTPYNILRTGIRISPVGGVLLANELVSGGFARIRNGKPMTKTHPLMVQHAAEQIIAWSAALLLAGAVEGGDDDDDQWLLITGTRKRGAAGDQQARTYPATSVRIFGKWFNYGSIEPVATALGIFADAVRNHNGGSDGSLVASVRGQIEGKTFLKGLSDLWDGIDRMTPKMDADGTTRAPEMNMADALLKSAMTALVPNLIRQTVAASDDTVRDWKSQEWWHAAFPSGAGASPQIDVMTGEPVKKPGNMVTRLLFPFLSGPPEQIAAADKMLMQWNRDNPDKRWLPDDASRVLFMRGTDGKLSQKVELSPQAYEYLQRRSAVLAQQRMPQATGKVDEPVFRRIRDAFNEGRDRAREELRRWPLEKLSR